MPRNPGAAKRYAEALHETLGGKNEFVTALEELKAFSQATTADKALHSFFSNPTIQKSQKLEVLSGLKEKLPTTYRFLFTMLDANRFELLGEVLEQFQAILDEASGDLSVEVEVAHPVSDRLLEDIRSFLQERWKRNLKVKTTINSKLIGGFVARAPGRIVDASVASQLETLEQQVLA